MERIASGGGQALAVSADATDIDAVNAAVERVAGALGPPTILVNKSGVTRGNRLLKMTDAYQRLSDI